MADGTLAAGTLGDGFGPQRIDPHRPGDVLDALLAHVLERVRQPVADLVAHRAGDADAAGLGQRLQPRRDIDAVAEDVVVLGDDVAEIDADAKPACAAPRANRGSRSSIARCTSAAQRTASTTLANSASTPSPVVLTMRP